MQYCLKLLIFTIFLTPSTGFAAEKLTIDEWLDLYVQSCVGSGSSDEISGSVNADAEISLRRLTADGTLKAETSIKKSELKLLTTGISNKITSLQADQADKVRDCLDPLRNQMLSVFAQQHNQIDGSQPQSNTKSFNIYILSPTENKVIEAIANTKGEDPLNNGIQSGIFVTLESLEEKTKMSQIILRHTIKQLERKKLITLTVKNWSSLTDQGDEYVISRGFVK